VVNLSSLSISGSKVEEISRRGLADADRSGEAVNGRVERDDDAEHFEEFLEARGAFGRQQSRARETR
jgi:hypothetical protein